MSYVPPYELTKLDIAAMRAATYMVASHNVNGDGAPRIEFAKEFAKSDKNPYATTEYHLIEAPIRVPYNYKQPDAQYRCLTSVRFYASQACQASSALATLRAGDAVAFQFYPDSHTNQYLEEKELHGDALNMLVFRKGKHVATFELQTSVTPDNSARMCRVVAKQYQLA